MQIENIKLKNFRNYEYQEIKLKDGITVFYGNNAHGKTNILESIYICALGKSFRTKKDVELIKFGETFLNVEVEYLKKDRKGKVKVDISDKKTFYNNGIKAIKTSEILGKIYIVLFSPDDIEILKSGPSSRRRFLNVMISQLKPNYVHILNDYMKTLEQRNAYLKQIKFEGKEESILEIWDEKLAEFAEKIYSYRVEFIDKIKKKINVFHNKITDNKEILEIKYISQCSNKENFLEKLRQERKADIKKGFSNLGIHRDDFCLATNNKELQIYGSQGQQKTAILSLKLSELEIIYEETGEKPILLLDDFMSELDESRRNRFLENIENTQVLITATDKINIIDKIVVEYRVKDGKIN